MSEWKYKSLERIHKVREENYERTKDKSLKEVIRESVENTSTRSCNIVYAIRYTHPNYSASLSNFAYIDCRRYGINSSD
jgi:hypothetical protein